MSVRPDRSVAPMFGSPINLTAREYDILVYVCIGLSNKLTAKVFDISPRTVEIHKANITHKLGVNTSSQAAILCLLADLVPKPLVARHMLKMYKRGTVDGVTQIIKANLSTISGDRPPHLTVPQLYRDRACNLAQSNVFSRLSELARQL